MEEIDLLEDDIAAAAVLLLYAHVQYSTVGLGRIKGSVIVTLAAKFQ